MPAFDPAVALPFSLPSESQKVAVVTGANTGIGYYTVLHLYMHGFRVYMACRTELKANQALKKVQEDALERQAQHPKLKDATFGELFFLKIDLESLKSTEEAAEVLKRQEPQGIDVLINNAGVMAMPVSITEDGYDVQLQVNHVAPTLLTLKLLPLLLAKKEPGRVVNVSSLGHNIYDGSCDFSKTYDYWPLTFWSFVRYGQAKTANIQFAKALGKRFPTQLLSTAVHPGICIGTELARYWDDKFFSGLAVRLTFLLSGLIGGISVEEGSYTSLYCALSSELTPEKDNGKFYRPWPHEAFSSWASSNPAKIEKTWDWTITELEKKGFLDAREIASFKE